MDGAGTVSGRWALAAGRAAVKGCRICHGPSLPGMRLCTQCKAALKRARQETVSELIPAPARTRSARDVRRPAATKPLVEPAHARSQHRFGAPRILAIVLCVVAAAGVGYGALHFVRSTPVPLPAPPVAAPSSIPDPAPAPAPLAEAKPAQTRTETVTPFVPPVQRSASKPAERAAPKRAADPPSPAPEAPTIARFAAATEPPTPQPAPEPPAPRPAPAPDRWQLMADAIDKCGREGFLAGVICEQRVRLQYCEGYWGKAAQCPSGIANDHGA